MVEADPPPAKAAGCRTESRDVNLHLHRVLNLFEFLVHLIEQPLGELSRRTT